MVVQGSSFTVRDELCTLRWDIWEQFGITNRSELPDNAKQLYIDGIMANKDNGLTIDDLIASKYKYAEITNPIDAFKHLDSLIPSKENAFLFNESLRDLNFYSDSNNI